MIEQQITSSITSGIIKTFTNFIADNNGLFILLLLLFVLIWLLLREVKTWYWKVNKIVSLLEGIELSVRKLSENNTGNINSKRDGNNGGDKPETLTD